jgi:hypothetical protein
VSAPEGSGRLCSAWDPSAVADPCQRFRHRSANARACCALEVFRQILNPFDDLNTRTPYCRIGSCLLLLNRRSGPPFLLTYRHVRPTRTASLGTSSSSINLVLLCSTPRSLYLIPPYVVPSQQRITSGKKKHLNLSHGNAGHRNVSLNSSGAAFTYKYVRSSNQ